MAPDPDPATDPDPDADAGSPARAAADSSADDQTYAGPETPLTDKGRLVFGAGFAFGVACTLALQAVAVASLGTGMAPDSGTALTAAAGVLFALVVGAGLYLLAFPENRLLVPIDTERAED